MPNWAGDLDLDPGDLDEGEHTLGSLGLKAGDGFEYIFDLGDVWLHDCTVLRDDVEPQGEFGEITKDVVPVVSTGRWASTGAQPPATTLDRFVLQQTG